MQIECAQDGAAVLTARTCFDHRVVPSHVFPAAQEWARTHGAVPFVHYERRTVDVVRVNTLVSFFETQIKSTSENFQHIGVLKLGRLKEKIAVDSLLV